VWDSHPELTLTRIYHLQRLSLFLECSGRSFPDQASAQARLLKCAISSIRCQVLVPGPLPVRYGQCQCQCSSVLGRRKQDQAQVLRQLNALVVSPLPLLSVGTSPLVQKISKREETRSGIPPSLMNCVGDPIVDSWLLMTRA
jgi:hypothetical protein